MNIEESGVSNQDSVKIPMLGRMFDKLRKTSPNLFEVDRRLVSRNARNSGEDIRQRFRVIANAGLMVTNSRRRTCESDKKREY